MKALVKPLLMALACTFCASAANAATSNPDAANATYDPLVDAVVAHYHLPGIAVGVIKDGKVVYKRVIGKLPSGQPMNDDTLFKIGSVTKAMTVTLLARLVEQGKLQWKAPVTQYLPSFQMHDPWVTKNMQVRDLLSHHSGLHGFAGDFMLWPNPNHFTPADVVHALRYLKPVYSFRAGYAYDNVLFVTAGQVAAAAGGAPYAKLMYREVLRPMGMDRCQIGTWNREKVGNVARPNVWHDGKYVPVSLHGPIHHATTMDAAGGVSCSLNGMLKWAKNWLEPTPQQLQWLTPEQRHIEWTPHTPVPISKQRRAWNHTRLFSNALGWRISDADGEITVWHTGVLKGMRAALMLLPFRNSGYVVLINSGADDALAVLDEVLLKQFTAPSQAKSVATYAQELKQYEAEDQTPAAKSHPRQAVTPAELKTRLGVWESPWFGEVRICPKGNTVQFSPRKSPLLDGQIMRVGKRYLVDWKHASDAWLYFPEHAGGTLHLTRVNPDADAINDLLLTRKGNCP